MNIEKITIELDSKDLATFSELWDKITWLCDVGDYWTEGADPMLKFTMSGKGSAIEISQFQYLLFKILDAVASQAQKGDTDE